MRLLTAAALFAAGAALLFSGASVLASSHSDAPLIKQDPQANITDVYSFIGTKYNNVNQKVLNVIVHVRPFSEPGDGVMYERFADDALYSIHITDPNTGATLVRYNFQFSSVNTLTAPGLKNPNTILSYGVGTEAGSIRDIGDARQNYSQTYTLTKVVGTTSTVLGTGLRVPPPNVGVRTTPYYNDSQSGKAISGAPTFESLDRYTQQAITGLTSGEAVFAGSREDGFYADTPAIFDLLDPRILDNDGDPGDGFGQDGGGVDDFKGFNVLAFAIQIPVSALPSIAYNTPALIGGAQAGVGVYASVSRPRITLRRTDGDPVLSGPYIQVNRMGNPLFNEVLVALKDKDKYNRTSPTGDSAFATYATNPEVAILINFIYGTSFVTTGRADLKQILLGSGSGADVLRVNTTTPPVTLAGQAGFNRLSFLGSDLTTGTSGPVPAGWPNGRRLGDDVVDIALTAVASGPAYSTVVVVGDNSAANDQVYHQVFPYSATPHAGPRHSKDSGPNAE